MAYGDFKEVQGVASGDGFTVGNASLAQLKKWKSNPKVTDTMSASEIRAMNARIKELTARGEK